MKRYKLLIRYDGEKFYGWQIQKDRRTVQGVIENALSQVFKIKSRVIVHGAGRTDSGVHAYQQVAHFDFLTNLNENDLRNALNSKLEIDCKIIQLLKVVSFLAEEQLFLLVRRFPLENETAGALSSGKF